MGDVKVESVRCLSEIRVRARLLSQFHLLGVRGNAPQLPNDLNSEQVPLFGLPNRSLTVGLAVGLSHVFTNGKSVETTGKRSRVEQLWQVIRRLSQSSIAILLSCRYGALGKQGQQSRMTTTLEALQRKACLGIGKQVVKYSGLMNLSYITNKRTDGANPFRIFESLTDFDSEELAVQLKLLPYKTFLQTAYWFAVSSVAKSRAGMRCQVCNSPKAIQPHHRTYQTHGYEHLHMEDLVVLCGSCHGLFHGHITTDYVPPALRERKKRDYPGAIVPHTESDLGMPDGESFKLDHDLINACRANGSFTNATLRAFGLKRPLFKGWVDRLIGITLTRSQYQQALRGRFIYRSGPLEQA